MRSSPCYKCPDNPCKHHDTCKEYQDFRKERAEMHKKITAENIHNFYIRKSVARCKKYQNRKKEN